MPVQTFAIGPLGTNCYVFHNDVDAVMIDPGGSMNEGLNEVMHFLNIQKLQLRAILCTHLHFDHILGVAHVHEVTGAPIYAHEDDRFMLDNEMGGGGKWGFPKVIPFSSTALAEGSHSFGSITIKALHTPGHTPGGVSLYVEDEQVLFSGDLLFFRSVGRTDFPRSDTGALLDSIKTKVYALPSTTVVYPGHGPSTTVADEMASNPFTQ